MSSIFSRVYSRFPVVLCILASVLGCGGKDYGVDLHPATGVVTLDGAPLADATVYFRPHPQGAGNAPRGGVGFTDDEGKYILLFRDGRGCPAGTFKVAITTYSEPHVGNEEGSPQLVPQKYRGDSTSLRAEVVAGQQNTFDFDLKSPPE